MQSVTTSNTNNFLYNDTIIADVMTKVNMNVAKHKLIKAELFIDCDACVTGSNTDKSAL